MQYLWSLYDNKARAYVGVFPTSSFVEGLRAGKSILTDERYDYYKYVLDYTFNCVGFFNDQTGALLPTESICRYDSSQVAGLLDSPDLEIFDLLSCYYDSSLSIPRSE